MQHMGNNAQAVRTTKCTGSQPLFVGEVWKLYTGLLRSYAARWRPTIFQMCCWTCPANQTYQVFSVRHSNSSQDMASETAQS